MLKGAIPGFLLQTGKKGGGWAVVENEYASKYLPHFHFCPHYLSWKESDLIITVDEHHHGKQSRTVPGREKRVHGDG